MEDRGSVGRCFGEGAIAGLGDDGVDRAQQVGKTKSAGLHGDGVGMRAPPVAGNQPADAGPPRPVVDRQAVRDTAHGDQHCPVTLQAEVVAPAAGGNRADIPAVGQRRHRHARGGAQEGLRAAVGGEHLAVDRGGPCGIAEEMREEVGPVERAQGERRNPGARGTCQRQVADVAEHQLGRQIGQKGGLAGDP